MRVGSGPGTSLQVLSLQMMLQLMLVDLMLKVVEPKVVEWTRLGREEIVPNNKKPFLCTNCICFPKTYM